MSIDVSSTWGRIFCTLLLSWIIAVSSVYARASGSMRGRVIDKETGEPLIGASIIVENTSLGTAADIDGKFYLPIVPVGKLSIKVTYIGYVQVTREITITENAQLVEDDFKLTPQALIGEVVVVTAQARGQMEAINQQLSTNKIVNIVSEDKIKELPDFNAAEAIGRLPGVTTQRSSGEANKIVVRGIAPQYNLVAVDGVKLSSNGNAGGITVSPQFPGSPNTQDRSVDVSMIPSSMLQSIEVYKSLTPDMDGDAIGGYVNMKLREAPSGFHSDLMWQSGYVKKSSKYDNYKVMASASDRFFDDDLGAYLQFNAEKYDRGADFFDGGYNKTSDALIANPLASASPVVVNYYRLRRHFETRNRYGVNLILDYRLPNGTIKAFNMFGRMNSDGMDYSTQMTNGQTPSLNMVLSNSSGNNDIMSNALQIENDFGFLSADFGLSNSYSRNFIPNMYSYTFTAEGAVRGQIPNNTRPEDLVTLISINQNRTYLQYLSDGRYDYKENGQTLTGNFKIPFNVKSYLSGYFKFGGKARYAHRVNDQDLPYAQIYYGGSENLMQAIGAQFSELERDSLVVHNTHLFFASNFGNPDQSIARNILDNKFGDLLWVPTSTKLEQIVKYIESTPSLVDPTQPNGWVPGPFQNLINDYDNIERHYAGYSMAELDLGQNLIVVGGARYEEERIDFTAYRMKQSGGSTLSQTYKEVIVNPWNHFWLPMIQAKYQMFEWLNLRYSYTQTLSRPDFTAMSPFMNANTTGATIYAGNPDLVPAQAYNHDVMVTFHDNYVGLFSIGAFYKSINNFIYSTQYILTPDSLALADFKHTSYYSDIQAVTGAQVNTWMNNPNTATLKGLELDWQTRFWYLPFPLNGVVLNVNYTHITSEVNYPVIYIGSILVGTPPRVRNISVAKDTVRSGRLIEQPSDIVNAAIGYDYKGFSGRISFLYQGEVVQYISNVPENDSYKDPYFRIDASISQYLPWYGIQLYLDINNINERADIAKQKSLSGYTSEQFYGLTADLGVRIRL
jgi:TonB-dependent receptor